MPVVCLYFPRLKADLAVRSRPELRGRPVVLMNGVGPEARVTGRSARAVLLGVLPAMTAGTALARAPQAAFLPDNSVLAVRTLAEAAEGIMSDGAGVVEVGDDFLAVHTGRHVSDERILAAAAVPLASIAVRVGRGDSVSEALAAARTPHRDRDGHSSVHRLRAS